jgi:hypothetical protein
VANEHTKKAVGKLHKGTASFVVQFHPALILGTIPVSAVASKVVNKAQTI